ncbi:MAG: protein phosphatase 2C domain-containing protein [Moorellaceae bacterium]
MLLPKRLEAVTLAGGEVNHDAYGIVPGSWCFWAIDGATALAPAGENELQAFVQCVNEEIGKHVTDSRIPLRRAMAAVAGAVLADFSGFPREPWERPSCSVALARVDGMQLEYFVLGDAAVVADTPDGVRVFSGKEDIARLDRIAIQEKTRLQIEKGISSREARAAIQPTLRKHRALMNKPGGYWIFNGDLEPCFNAVCGSVDLPPGGMVLAATDGFTRLVDTLGVFPDWVSLLSFLQQTSLKDLLQILREAEDKDPECLEHPRFWIYDDATAVFVKF